MRVRAAVTLVLGLAAAFGAGRAMPHESWLEPSSFEIEPGRPIGVRVCVADGFEGWSLARNPGRIARFVAVDEAGEVPVVGLEGSDPAGVVRLTRPGDYVIVYESRHAVIQVQAGEFEAFLREKGLDQVIRRRAGRGARTATIREAYSRHAKALVRVGEAAAWPDDRRIGMTLELVAESHIAEHKSAERTFRLLHRGRPLANALVVATRLGTADQELRARTGADGRAQFRLGEDGLWRIATVHMVEAAHGSGAEWESLWASLSLHLAPAGAPPLAQTRTACANRWPPQTAGGRA